MENLQTIKIRREGLDEQLVQADYNYEDLYNETGSLLAHQTDLNLTDMLFKYGIRINPLLVKDEQATPIKLATGKQGSETQYEQLFASITLTT